MMVILKKTIYQSTNKEIFNELIKERREKKKGNKKC